MLGAPRVGGLTGLSHAPNNPTAMTLRRWSPLCRARGGRPRGPARPAYSPVSDADAVHGAAHHTCARIPGS
eukprot:1034149-Lingulodinium_polyedra.AAC.1